MIDEAWYEGLVRDFSSWNDPTGDDGASRLLLQEARLLDQGRLDDWLGLFAAECVYWMPASVPAGDPRHEVAIAFDDRRRLEDRVYRLKTGNAWSQQPASRTVRMVSNVEAFSRGRVRANLLVAEFRGGETRTWAAWCGYRIRDGKIEVKQVNLVDCDQNLRNPSLLF